MSVVHLIIQKEDFYIPKKVLRKSRYFRNLLKIQDNDIEVENISPLIFRNLIALLTSDIDIQKEIAILHDFLEVEGRLDFIQQYHCQMKNCDKISLIGGFCIFHKCIIDACQQGKMHKRDYCHIHVCPKHGCDQPNLIADCDLDGTVYGNHYKYCKKHTEKTFKSEKNKEYSDRNLSRKCSSTNKEKIIKEPKCVNK